MSSTSFSVKSTSRFKKQAPGENKENASRNNLKYYTKYDIILSKEELFRKTLKQKILSKDYGPLSTIFDEIVKDYQRQLAVREEIINNNSHLKTLQKDFDLLKVKFEQTECERNEFFSELQKQKKRLHENATKIKELSTHVTALNNLIKTNSDSDNDNGDNSAIKDKITLLYNVFKLNFIDEINPTSSSSSFTFDRVSDLSKQNLFTRDSSSRYSQQSSRRSSFLSQHNWVLKSVIRYETCCGCTLQIPFGKTVYKCIECKGICHEACRDKLPLPCVTSAQQRSSFVQHAHHLNDLVPKFPPFIPPFLYHCLQEIEHRGLGETDLYKRNGPSEQVKKLKISISKLKSTPNLRDENIFVISSLVLTFLNSLDDAIVPKNSRSEFIEAIQNEEEYMKPALTTAVYNLPPANRDTLACLIVHMQKVLNSQHCSIIAKELAELFGSLVVGNSSKNVVQVLKEASQITVVMEQLLAIPTDFWTSVSDATFHEDYTDAAGTANSNRRRFLSFLPRRSSNSSVN